MSSTLYTAPEVKELVEYEYVGSLSLRCYTKAGLTVMLQHCFDAGVKHGTTPEGTPCAMCEEYIPLGDTCECPTTSTCEDEWWYVPVTCDAEACRVIGTAQREDGTKIYLLRTADRAATRWVTRDRFELIT